MLPTLPLSIGVTWNARATPRFSTVTQYPTSGQRPVSFSTSPYPSWEWELSWDILRDQGLFEINDASVFLPDYHALRDFYLSMNGSNGRFIYDPAARGLEDCFITQLLQNPAANNRPTNTLVNGYSGPGDGVQTVFQLYRTSRVTGNLLPVEPIDALSAICSQFAEPPGGPFNVYVNNELVDPSRYSYTRFPLEVTFVDPPAVGAIVSWTGIYAYVVKFQEDKIDFNEWSERLWEMKSLKIEQVPLGT